MKARATNISYRPGVLYRALIVASALVVTLVVGGGPAHGQEDKAADAGTRAIRGLSLKGIPSFPSTEPLPEAGAGAPIELSTEPGGGEPVVLYFPNKPHFYLRTKERTYGPVPGNPFEKLHLTEVLKTQLAAAGREAAARRLFGLVSSGDDVLKAVAYRLIPELDDLGHLALVAAIRQQLRDQPTSPTVPAGRVALEATMAAVRAALYDEAEARWKDMRVKVPDEDYKPGKRLGDEEIGILWGDPNERGLRLGVAGLTSETPLPVGQPVHLRLFVRNDGDKEVRFTSTGFWGVGLQLVLTDEAGKTVTLVGDREVRGLDARVRLAPERFHECELTAIRTIVPMLDGSPSTKLGLEPALILQPGRYKVDLKFQIGIFDIRSDWRKPDPRTVPALGEWTGTLAAPALEVQFGSPEIRTAKPGDLVEFSRRHRLHFEKGKISLTHYCGWPGRNATRKIWNEKSGEWEKTAWGETHDLWETQDPSGEFLAAWDVGGIRFWYVDATGISYLEIHDELHGRGHWTMAQAGGDLADMPDGVRVALKLPARDR